MFEQAVLSNGSTGRRVWMTSAGMVGETLVLLVAVAATLLWPGAMPKVQAILVAPPAPIAGPANKVKVEPRGMTVPVRPVDLSKLVQPTAVVPHPPILTDAPEVSQTLIGGGDLTASNVGLATGIPAALPVPVKADATPVEKPKPAAKPAEPAAIQRIQGGMVDPSRLTHYVQPVYPAIARTAHISGMVEISGVIGADGRVRELKVVRGHALLIRAALDAVSQWIYQPTRLNGQIVEVVTTIQVNFTLNQ